MTFLGKIHRKCPDSTRSAADEKNDTVTALGGMCRRWHILLFAEGTENGECYE